MPPRMRRRPPAEADGAVWFIVEAAGMREGGSVRGRGEGDHGQVVIALHSPEWCVSVVFSFLGTRVILALYIMQEYLRNDMNSEENIY